MTTATSPPSLQTFTLADLQQFTKEGAYASLASKDFHLFYVGRDDVHGILKYLLSRTRVSLYLNMYGYDDDELNDECMRCACDPSITTLITLDETQAGGVHEKTILGSDMARNPAAFNTHTIVIGRSATRQISHTKGGVLDGRVGFEGSTNWSAASEGTFVLKDQAGGSGYKAQNNTLAVFTDPDAISRFTAELIAEHMAATGGGLGSTDLAGMPGATSPGAMAPASGRVRGVAMRGAGSAGRRSAMSRRTGARGRRG